MSFFEGRPSDSPYIEAVYRGQTDANYAPVCPADEHWNLLFTWSRGDVTTAVEGPLTRATAKFRLHEAEFLVIRFRLGVFMPSPPVGSLLDGAVLLPGASSQKVWMYGGARQFPDYENAETFVERLVRDGALIRDALVPEALRDRPQPVSPRTVRRRFQHATGLTQGAVRQIERARQAAALLQQGIPILDAVHEAGYADQPHMTRALKRYVGQTPAQILRLSAP